VTDETERLLEHLQELSVSPAVSTEELDMRFRIGTEAVIRTLVAQNTALRTSVTDLGNRVRTLEKYKNRLIGALVVLAGSGAGLTGLFS